jgi:hypothetical protein
MRRSTVYLFVLLMLMSLSLVFVRQVSSQPENIKALSYSWYVDSLGLFDVVGEVQNVGPNTIESVVLGGTVYTTDGEAQTHSSPTFAYVNCLLPQQKAAFFMDFPSQNSVTGDLSWLSIGVDRVDFTVIQANVTNSYQYPYLTVKGSSGAADGEGVYWVSGSVENSGSQTATNIRVIGTFYNASGTVVGVGYTDYLTPNSLNPSGVASFKVGAFDQNETVVPSIRKISSYSLLIQAEQPLLSGTPPSLPPSNSSSTTPPSNSTPSPTIAPETQYVAVIVIVILGLAGTILVLSKRKSKAKSQATRNPNRKCVKNRNELHRTQRPLRPTLSRL